jgi:predicted permease
MFAILRKLRLRRRLEREMQEEAAHHLEARAADLEACGLSREEAGRRARVEFGGVERYKEELRQERRFTWFEDFSRDVGYAARNLRRTPLFTVCAAGALALGIGLNSALFSIAYGVLFRPLPVADPESLRTIYVGVAKARDRAAYESSYFPSYTEFEYLRAHAHGADIAGISESIVTAPFADAGLHAELVSSNLLTICGARLALGSLFRAEDDAVRNAGAVVVLSYDAWQRYFHGENVTGRTILLNRTAFTIIGVANQGFYGPELLKADLWLPLTMQPITRAGEPLIDNPNAGFVQVLARLHPGQTDSALRAELQVLAQQTVNDHASPGVATVILSPAAFLNAPDAMKQTVPVLAILLAAVSLVLLAACANVANMLVARGFGRAREISIRVSIGAGRGRIVRQLLTEHLLLGVCGGVAGLALGQIVVRAVLAMMSGLPAHQIDVTPDWNVAAWTIFVTLGAGLVFGLPAALGIVRRDLAQSVRGSAFEAGVRGSRFQLQTGLTAAQVAISALLLVNAALLARAAQRAIHLDPGFSTSGVLAVRPNLRESQYTPERAERYLREFRVRAAGIPGVTGVSWTGFEPIRSNCDTLARVSEAGGMPLRVACNEVGIGYFSVMGIRLLQGRGFDATDEAPSARTVIVDEVFARQYLPGNPLGRRVGFGGPGTEREVIGVVGSTRNMMAMRSQEGEIYRPLTGLRYLEAWAVVSYRGPQAPVTRAIRSLSGSLDRDTSLLVRTIEENLANALAAIRIAAAGATGLGVLALVLACAGVYGVVAFTVGRRRREIGIRMALGAQRGSVVRLFLWQSLRAVAIGGATGAVLAVGGAEMIRTALYGVSPADPVGLIAALGLLGGVAIAAALLPASAAMRVDPAVTLRHD